MIRSRIPPPPAPGPLSRAAAPHPDQGHGAGSGPALSTARELADDLDAFRRGEPVSAAARRPGCHAAHHSAARMPTATKRDAPVLARIRRKAKRGARPAASVPPPARRSRLGHVPQNRTRSGRSAAGGHALRRLGRHLRAMFSISTARHWSARSQPNRSPTPTRSGTDGRNFPGQSLVFPFARTAKAGEAEARGGGGPRDRHLPEQRCSRFTRRTGSAPATMLARALSLDPDDSVRGKLRLAEGHLARINGTAHRNRGGSEPGGGEIQRGRSSCCRNRPIPQLGLARVYVYGLKDIDKATRRSQEAEKRGYHLGNREKSAARRRLPRPRRPPLLGFAQRARPAAGEGPDRARRQDDIPARWSCIRASLRMAMSNAQYRARARQPGERRISGCSEIERGNVAARLIVEALLHDMAVTAQQGGGSRGSAPRPWPVARGWRVARTGLDCWRPRCWSAPGCTWSTRPRSPILAAGRAGAGRQAALESERPERARRPAAGARASFPMRASAQEVARKIYYALGRPLQRGRASRATGS